MAKERFLIMNKISAIILTKNSEELIADCIDSVSFCNEVIVIDDSSTDRTPDLAKHLGARVFNYRSKSFAEKRNFGLEKAKYKWVLYIDDDERVTKKLRENILKVAEKQKDVTSAYRVKRKNFYLGNHEWPRIEKMERLFIKNYLEKWVGKLHETAIVKGDIGELEGFVDHYTHQDLTKMVNKTIEWSRIEADLRYKANHPRMSEWRFFRVMLTAFYDSFITQKGYKARTAGLIESIYQAFSIFITYARLWELQNKNNSRKSE